MMMTAMMFPVVMFATRHGLGCDSFSAISRRLSVARGLLNPAGRSLCRRGRLLRLGSSSLGARSSLVSAVGRVHGPLRRIGLTRRATCRKCKG
jgi:hypothetical protein